MSRRDILLCGLLLLALLSLIPLWIVRGRALSRRDLCERRQFGMFHAMVRRFDLTGDLPGYRNVQAETSEGKTTHTGWVFPLLPYIGYAEDIQADPEGLAGNQNETLDEEARQANAKRLRFQGFPKQGAYEEIYDLYGPAGPNSTRGQTPEFLLPVCICPDDQPNQDDSINYNSWVVNTGMADATNFDPSDWLANGVFFDATVNLPNEYGSPIEFIQQNDGLEHTLAISENVQANAWTDAEEWEVGFVWNANRHNPPRPLPTHFAINKGIDVTKNSYAENPYAYARPSSRHIGGVNAIFTAGNSRFISEEVDPEVVREWMTSNDAEAKFPGGNELVYEFANQPSENN